MFYGLVTRYRRSSANNGAASSLRYCLEGALCLDEVKRGEERGKRGCKPKVQYEGLREAIFIPSATHSLVALCSLARSVSRLGTGTR